MLVITFSRAQVHPRVIGYDAEDHKGFATLHEARESFEKRGIAEYEEAPECSSKCERVLNSEQGVYYYAVAYGKTVGVFNTWK
jgi:viroplasmin and RNaseH domain-containing protein